MMQIPDNWMWSESYNLPLDEMMETIDIALENGYTVGWDADVSDKGFGWKKKAWPLYLSKTSASYPKN